jgi:hypothetical protein
MKTIKSMTAKQTKRLTEGLIRATVTCPVCGTSGNATCSSVVAGREGRRLTTWHAERHALYVEKRTAAGY